MRNTQARRLILEIVQAIVEDHLADFTAFTEAALRTNGFRNNDY